MPEIRKQIVYKGKDKTKTVIHPETEVAAISDMGDALDEYKKAYIDPYLGVRVHKIVSGDKQEALTYSANNPGVLVLLVKS